MQGHAGYEPSYGMEEAPAGWWGALGNVEKDLAMGRPRESGWGAGDGFPGDAVAVSEEKPEPERSNLREDQYPMFANWVSADENPASMAAAYEELAPDTWPSRAWPTREIPESEVEGLAPDTWPSRAWPTREIPESEVPATLGKAAADPRARAESQTGITMLNTEIANLDAEIAASSSRTALAKGEAAAPVGMWDKINKFESDLAFGQVELGDWASKAGRWSAACFLAGLLAHDPAGSLPSWQYMGYSYVLMEAVDAWAKHSDSTNGGIGMPWDAFKKKMGTVALKQEASDLHVPQAALEKEGALDDPEMRNVLFKGMLRSFRQGQRGAFKEVLEPGKLPKF